MAGDRFIDRALAANAGVPILGQPKPQANGTAAEQTVVMHTVTIGHTLGTDESGVAHALLTFQFSGPGGPSPTIVLILQDDDLLNFPDAVRKIVREARGKAEIANLDRKQAAGETTAPASDIPPDEPGPDDG